MIKFLRKNKFLNNLCYNVKSFLCRLAGSFKAFYSDYRAYILTALTLGSLALSVFYFQYCGLRLVESVIDLGTSLGYYINYVYDLRWDITATVMNFSKYDIAESINLPYTWDEFKELWVRYWHTWATKENFVAYLSWLGDFLFYFTQILLILSPLIIVVIIVFRKYLGKINNDYNVDSKPLKLHRKFTHYVLSPVQNWIHNFVEFIKSHPLWWKTFLFIWAYNFNLITIFVEFFAYYFYFVASFEFSTLYTQLVKLLTDLSVIIFSIPPYIWLIVALVAWELICIKRAYANLQHCERRDRGFINERSLITFVCGTMGSGKTTAITDMALSESVEFHDQAFKIILDIDFEFFRFPWQNFQQWLKTLFKNHKIFSPYTCREIIKQVHAYLSVAEQHPEYAKSIRRYLKKEYYYTYGIKPFDYDIEHYGSRYWNGVLYIDLWQDLEDYAQAYLIYIMTSSLILANYSIRTDEDLFDLGNFPIWDSNFFRKEKRRIIKSHHAHILDFDMLRLGKKIVANNPNFYAFGVGVYVISEIDKERQNNLNLQEIKASSTECNQKNDMFNEMLKMVRHATVIRNVPFVHFFVDAQRPEDWGANARETAEVVHISNKCEPKVLLPWFSPWRFFELIYDFVYSKISNVYVNYSVNRGDNTWLLWAFKWLGAKFKQHYERTYNKFGCVVLNLDLESGKLDGDLSSKKYFLCFQKIYKDRFNTAAMSGFFAKIAKHAELGLNDLPEYMATTATDDELALANSHFFRRIAKYSDMVEDDFNR